MIITKLNRKDCSIRTSGKYCIQIKVVKKLSFNTMTSVTRSPTKVGSTYDTVNYKLNKRRNRVSNYSLAGINGLGLH